MPGPYDGYLVELAGGQFKVETNGVVVDTYRDEEAALAVLFEHAGERPKWRVTIDGETTGL